MTEAVVAKAEAKYHAARARIEQLWLRPPNPKQEAEIQALAGTIFDWESRRPLLEMSRASRALILL